MPHSLRCVIHGSFRKHFAEVCRAKLIFEEAGIEVLAPKTEEITRVQNGFALFAGEEGIDPCMVELLYLQKVKRLGREGFSYFVNPDGYIGKSASYELGIAQVTNVPCFFLEPLDDHPAYTPKNTIITPEFLAEYIQTHGRLPEPHIARDEQKIHELWENLMVPGSVVAVGGIIEFDDPSIEKEKDILLVKTHKWGGRFSIVGGRVRRNETLKEALVREVREETGLDSAVGDHLCTFDQIKNSGYYQRGLQHVFVDNVVRVQNRQVQLNEEAQEYVWMPATQALKELDLEPNARLTVELYAKKDRPL